MTVVMITSCALLPSSCARARHETAAGPVSAVAISQLPSRDVGTLLPPRRDAIDDLRDLLVRTQDERLAADAVQAQRRFDQLTKAGGFEAATRADLARLEHDIESGPLSIRKVLVSHANELKDRIKTLTVCKRPEIILYPATVEPYKSVVLEGCGFGDTAGEVHLIVSPGGGFLKFETLPGSWHSDTILTRTPNLLGVPDLPAKIAVVRADGVQSEPVDVQFISKRDYQIIDSRTHPRAETVDCAHTTQHDDCYSTYEDDALTLIFESFGAHHVADFPFNASSTAGDDHWYIRLQNGWTVVDFSFDSRGKTNCATGGFLNKPGRTDFPVISVPLHWTSPPYFTAGDDYTGSTAFGEPLTAVSSLDFSVHWWVDYACSVARYYGRILVTGPAATSY